MEPIIRSTLKHHYVLFMEEFTEIIGITISEHISYRWDRRLITHPRLLVEFKQTLTTLEQLMPTS
jgi:hypothetical protein